MFDDRPPVDGDELHQPTEPRDDEMNRRTMPRYDETDDDVIANAGPAEEDEDIPFRLPRSGNLHDEPTLDYRDDEHRMVTMPGFREPGVVDPRVTLPGTGGLDPNPDMPRQQAEQTVRHIPAVPIPHDQPGVPSPSAGMTMPNPSVADPRYQRPQAGAYVPPPPPDKRQAPVLKRRSQRRTIIGLPPGCFYAIIGVFLTFCGGGTLIAGAAAAFFIPRLEADWTARIERVDQYQAFESTFLYDRNGQLLYEVFGEGRRVSVPFERFPRHLINATIAIEDSSFYSNIGINVPATMVALWQYLGARPDEQTPGGSTITQQLVRNVLFDFQKRAERSVQRKAEEIILAILLTNRRSKDEIMALYLNEIYYGNLAYGAQVAAQTFFGKNVEDLTLGEAALLAGLPQAPATLDPLNPDPVVQERVYARQRQVLQEMVEDGFITAAERDQALRQGLNFSPQQTSLRAPHFTVYAQAELERLLPNLGVAPEELARGGYKVYTTVDLTVDSIALGAARTQVASLSRNNISNAAVVVLKPLTGEIMAMIGSVDYNNDAIDGRVNVTTALRQPGSTVKAFTYAAAIERGMSPGDVIWDTRTEIGIPGQPLYVPRNYDGRFHGPMIMRSALANSYNIPAVQTLRRIGVDYLLEVMRRFGISTLSQDSSVYGLSLTLGGGEVSLLELANGFSVFANQGTYVRPTSILCVIDRDGDVLYQYENGCPSGVGRFTPRTVDRTGYGLQVLDPRIAYLITDIMADNAARSPAMGGNSPLRTDGIGTASKTGTTNDVKDNWTVGYTRNVTVGVWVGNNNGDPMVNTSGLTGAAPIWNSVMNSIYADRNVLARFAVGGQLLPDRPNPVSGMSQRQICDVRRISDPSPACPATLTEWFLDGPPGIPDGNGNLQFPPVPASQSNNTPTIQEISPGVYRAIVFALPPELAAGIQFSLGPGDKQPLPPKYCRVPADQVSVAVGAQELVFAALPTTSQSDLVEAERYARDANIATLPVIDCWPDVYSVQSFAGGGITTAVITSPVNGQVISENIAIIGTANFEPGLADYYHLYIQGGPFADWTPLGQAGRNPVVNGQLEVLAAAGLPPGTYRLRLALQRDGEGFIQPPYEITFTRP